MSDFKLIHSNMFIKVAKYDYLSLLLFSIFAAVGSYSGAIRNMKIETAFFAIKFKLKSNGMNPRASSGLKKRCKHRGIKPRLRVRRSFTRRRIKNPEFVAKDFYLYSWACFCNSSDS